MDDLMEQLGSAGGSAGIGGLLGGILGGGDGGSDASSSATTEAASRLGLEALVGGLAQNASSRGGARSLDRALRKHDGSVLDDLPSNLGSARNTADGEKIVSHIFGKNQEAVTQSIASKSGMDLGSVTKLLPMLAPVVMGMLAKKRGGSSGGGGLAGMLGGEAGGLDLGDLAGLLGGGTGAAGGIGGLLKGLFGR